MKDVNEFKRVLRLLTIVKSLTGKVYKISSISTDNIYFSRGNKNDLEKIKIIELYNLFLQGMQINTTIAKKFISGKVQSPAVAIINHVRNKTLKPIESVLPEVSLKIENPKAHTTLKANDPIDDKDESRFFLILSQILKGKVFSKSLGLSFIDHIVWLSKDFRQYQFDQQVVNCYIEMLTELRSDFNLGQGNLSNHIDGLIKTSDGNFRIVEFDEEQHFTPARYITLKYVKKLIDAPYTTIYESICKNKTYYEFEVCKKNRIKKNKTLSLDYNTFIDQIAHENLSGYIEAKNGFNYIGGRIAQRAYYDTLRDTAHLSKLNTVLKPPLRFAKKTFEDIANKSFKKISNDDLHHITIKVLNDLYKINCDS